jgi:hypothetical protein
MRPLLISYGGGHANIIIALARELQRRGCVFDLIGLTTAFAAFRSAGLKPLDVAVLADLPQDGVFFDAVRRYLPAEGHPEIAPEQTHAYFALGFADLAMRFGWQEAHGRTLALGRKAFEPVSIFARYYLRNMPSLVVATTAPRFELAAIRAARMCGAVSLAVGDHFLVSEAAAIASGDHADHLVVLAESVAERLRGLGGALPELHVLGNPAFDALVPKPGDAARRALLRERIGLSTKRVVFWPLGGAAHSGFGERLLPPQEVVATLEAALPSAGNMRYILRAHPNWPVTPPEMAHGQMCPDDLSAEDCLLVADLVVAESTTLGLQALMRGVPVIAYGHADLTQYPHFGWATLVHSREELAGRLLAGDYARPPRDLSAHVGKAAAATADLIERLDRGALLPARACA